jgi:superfamily II DNA/RNA helicase
VSFDQFPLEPALARVLTELGFTEPTPVQSETLPRALAGADLLVSAATGSGKTLAYLLPALQRLIQRPPNPGPRDIGALVLSPTRELAKQIHKEFGQLARYTGLKSTLLTGGADLAYQASLLRRVPDLVVATPGRLLEHLQRGNLALDKLAILVLDEADRVVEMGFGQDVLTVAEQCNKDRQTLLFSATLNRKGLEPVREALLNSPELIRIDPQRQLNEAITQQMILADSVEHKLHLLTWLVANEPADRILVFANTRAQVDAITHALLRASVAVSSLHSERRQDERQQTLQRFRSGRYRVLVATDVAARGLDIEGLQLVINFEVPRSGDEFIHRVGRTGRAGEQGLAITLVSDPEWNLLASIQRYLKQSFERRAIPGLEGSYQGPKRLKASGKAAAEGKRRKKQASARPAPRKKERIRDRKQIGKRRQPAAADAEQQPAAAPKVWDRSKEVGFQPLRRKKPE